MSRDGTLETYCVFEDDIQIQLRTKRAVLIKLDDSRNDKNLKQFYTSFQTTPVKYNTHIKLYIQI